MTELTKIQDYLKTGWSNDITSQIQYLADLSVYKARVNELKVNAEKLYLNKLEQFRATDTAGMKQYEYNDAKDVYCMEEILYRKQVDGLSSSIENQHKALITIISHSKAEMMMLNN